MIADFLKRLVEPNPKPLAPPDARLALTALLVRIARSDGSYDDEEITRIDAISQGRFELSAAEANALRKEAEELEAAAPDTVRFTRAIKDTVAYEERIGVVEALWEVVLADGERDDAENALLRMVAPMLGVSDMDSHQARKRVEARL